MNEESNPLAGWCKVIDRMHDQREKQEAEWLKEIYDDDSDEAKTICKIAEELYKRNLDGRIASEFKDTSPHNQYEMLYRAMQIYENHKWVSELLGSNSITKVQRWRDMSNDELRLHCGEMTAQEIRSIKAVLNAILSDNV